MKTFISSFMHPNLLMHSYKYSQIHIHICKCIHWHRTYICNIYIYILLCIYVCMWLPLCVSVHVFTWIYQYIHICILLQSNRYFFCKILLTVNLINSFKLTTFWDVILVLHSHIYFQFHKIIECHKYVNIISEDQRSVIGSVVNNASMKISNHFSNII